MDRRPTISYGYYGGGRKGSSALGRLKEAITMLPMGRAVKFGRKLNNLKEKATPDSKAYSNADLAKFFQENMKKWSLTNRDINISTRYVRISVSTETETGDIISITISLESNFEAACDQLASFLSTCSFHPIDELFPRSSTKIGVIRLDTDAKHPAPSILWAGHNVFVHAEFRPSQTNKSTAPSRNNSIENFYSLTGKLFHYIMDGCVQAPENLVRPKLQMGETPDVVYVGETFSVNITCEPQCLYNVEDSDGGLVCADFEDDESRYTFTLVAMKKGQASVYFNFADPRTFNVTSVDFKIRVEPPQRTTEASASVMSGA